jgi:hypothetical protein
VLYKLAQRNNVTPDQLDRTATAPEFDVTPAETAPTAPAIA